jgi:hypothetical protein
VTIVKLAVVALAGCTALAAAAAADTETQSSGPTYYSDPMLFVDSGIAGAAAAIQLQQRSARPDVIRSAAVPRKAGGMPLPALPAPVRRCGHRHDAGCGETLEYFPDSHVDLDYFPHDSGLSHFPDSR